MTTQENKLITIETPLGKDGLLLAKLSGHEGISELFHFDLELFSERQVIAFEEIVGKNVTISIALADGSIRYLNGIVSGFSEEYGGESLGDAAKQLHSSYSATVVPWLWLLTRTAGSRIFQHLSVTDIAEKVFSEKGFTDYTFKLNGNYEPREYTVQYRESDFNFVSRLLEEEGIFYFFTHEDGKHTLVLADNPGASEPCPSQESARFKISGGEYFGDEDLIESLKMVKVLQAGKYSLNDYNYETPYTDLKVTTDTTSDFGSDALEKYDYPGWYDKRNQGESQVTLRMEEEESRITVLSGTGDCRAFCTGYRFRLENSDQSEWNDKEYLLTRIIHKADQAATYFTGRSDQSKQRVYTNRFECIPHEVPFRPERKTAKPVVDGVQTAVVVGPSGEDIYTDDFGRIKVQFHWDREGQYDENSSCWLRVGNAMAGNGWGTVMLPRVGHEVLVEFIEGNPDKPLVTGQVYHGVNRPPYKLPDERTKSSYKSNSSPDGGGFNEIRFEDKKGEEQLFFHAEKNQDIRVKEDCFEWIGQNRHLIVKTDMLVHVENNCHEKIDADYKEKIGKDKHLEVAGKEARKVGSSLSVTVTGDVTEVFNSNHSTDVTGNSYISATGVVIEATQGITLKCGGNSVVIDQTGVTVTGMKVTLDGKLTNINSGPGSPASVGVPGVAVPPASPEAAMEADVADPGLMARIKEQQVQTKRGKYGQQKSKPYKPPESKEEKEQKTKWVEIFLEDEEGNGVAGEYYEIKLPDGSVVTGTLDGDGLARVDGIDPGTCEVTFPHLDRDSWNPATGGGTQGD